MLLKSKYLTQDGITGFLRMIYDRGYNFLFYNPDKGRYTLSNEEPVFRGNTFLRCDGEHWLAQDIFCIDILKELLDGRNYIKIDEHIDVTDWSKVAIDTPILVSQDNEHWHRRYFASYTNGYFYAWESGATSWSVKDTEQDIWPWEFAKLADITKE